MNTDDLTLELSGAGGNWQVIDEVDDPTVIKQQDCLSCGPACGEMLLREQGISHINQENIASIGETPVNVSGLAETLNQLDPSDSRQWVGGYLEIPGANSGDVLELLIGEGSWIAELREPEARLGHLVVIDGLDSLWKILIKDPWDGVRYTMDKEEFLQFWTMQGIYRKEL